MGLSSKSKIQDALDVLIEEFVPEWKPNKPQQQEWCKCPTNLYSSEERPSCTDCGKLVKPLKLKMRVKPIEELLEADIWDSFEFKYNRDKINELVGEVNALKQAGVIE